MASPEEINADMLAFWNGQGGRTWVTRQKHTDTTLASVTDALLAFAAPRPGDLVLDVGCGCGGQKIMRPYIEYAERRLIWEHVSQHGDLPACNSE